MEAFFSRQAKAVSGLMQGVSFAFWRGGAQLIPSRGGVAVILCALVALAAGGSPSRGGFDTVINVPPDLPDASTIRSNTQVNVADGGNVGADVQLGSPSFVAFPNVPSTPSSHIELNVYGGTVGDVLRAGSLLGTDSDIVVNLYGGSIGGLFHADGGTTVNIFGGSIGDDFSAGHWAPLFGPATVGNPVVVNMSGGSIGALAGVGGTLNLSGGNIGQSFFGAQTLNMSGGVIDSWVHVENTEVANISGGQINYDLGVAGVANVSGGTIGTAVGVGAGGVLNFSGGTAGNSIHADAGSQLNISGGDFRLDGAPIAGLQNVGSSLPFNIPAGSLLTGTLADGTPIALTGFNTVEVGDVIADGALTLHTTAIPTAAPITFHCRVVLYLAVCARGNRWSWRTGARSETDSMPVGAARSRLRAE